MHGWADERILSSLLSAHSKHSNAAVKNSWHDNRSFMTLQAGVSTMCWIVRYEVTKAKTTAEGPLDWFVAGRSIGYYFSPRECDHFWGSHILVAQ
eukprot:scaffold22923_cov16-Prasinocladus_malaysianus.AAC.1